MNSPKFHCPKCDHELFVINTPELKSYSEFFNSVCNNCGSSVTENDVKQQLGEFADKLVRGMVRNMKP